MALVAASLAMPGAGNAAAVDPVAAVATVWRTVRQVMPASGRRVCLVISRDRHVTVRLVQPREAGEPSRTVVIGFDNQPGSLRYLRINTDLYQTDRPEFGGAEADAIIASLQLPGEFAYEWFRRPRGLKHGGLFGTGDFAAKFSECEGWVSATRA